MAQKFFGTNLRSRKIKASGRNGQINGLTPIKPAQDIADFEYPAESRFYQKSLKSEPE